MKNSKKSKPAPPAVKRDPIADAKFLYTSACCNELAKKTPLVAANKTTLPYLGAKPEAEGTLGSWRCGKCGRPCKVARHKKPDATTRVCLEALSHD